MIHIFYIRISILLWLIFICGCIKDVKEAGENPGLDTIPFYPTGSLAFDTRIALKIMEEDKKLEVQRKAGLEEELKKRLEVQLSPGDMPDPWIPPANRKLKDLPPALRGFPKDKFGYPDWTAAVKQEILRPRDTIIEGASDASQFDQDIIFEINDRLMADVRFSHTVHTFWLSCKICHPSIFIDRRGANKFTMYDVWQGKYCGRCHGKVAFQPKGFENCQRCHSVQKKVRGIR